jgi:uncharacterized membrane protein SpoIIM required for sporulation
MRAERFVAEHRAGWRRLNELVDKAQRSRLSSLSDEELLEMGALYRRAASDLARAQTRYASTHSGRELVRSLNDLVLRAHTQVYSAPPARPMRALNFLLYGFPAVVRRNWKPVALAAVLLYLPALLAYLNILVSINALALGVTAGLGTGYALIRNGLMIGGLSGVASQHDVDLLFWAVILPHGIIELTAICFAGGAGFVLARAIYAPGDLPRRDALQIAGGEAARLMVGVIVMLVIAGLIEGFITPQPIHPMLKISFALLTGVLLLIYLNARPKRAVVPSR